MRSLALDRDAWTIPVLALFAAVGNDAANDVWEAGRRVGTITDLTPAPASAPAPAAGAGRTPNEAAAVAAAAAVTDTSTSAAAAEMEVARAGDATKGASETCAEDDSTEDASRGRLAGFAPEHPPPVASTCVSFDDALDAISGKYVRREHVWATVEPGAMEAAARALDCRDVLRRLATTSPTGSSASGIEASTGAEAAVAMEKRAALLAAVRRGEKGAAVVALLLSNGARVDGGVGGGVAMVAAALEAGCQWKGTVMGMLKTAAAVQNVLFNVPGATAASGGGGGAAVEDEGNEAAAGESKEESKDEGDKEAGAV